MDANEVIGTNQNWVTVHDLKGKSVKVRIESVTKEASRFQPGQDRFVLKLSGTDKRLGLNKTNTRAIVQLYGTETDDWIGQEISLVPSQDRNAQGEMVPCIRIGKKELPEPKGFVSGLRDAARTAPVPKLKKIVDERNPPDDMNDEVPF